MPQIFTTEAEAVLLAVQRSHSFLRTMYGVIEDGYDVPVAMIYGGRIFPRKPLEDKNYTIDETALWIEDYTRYTLDDSDGRRRSPRC